jgi:hypothetical protein|tara:strand:+ start:26 stop:496 length:471 start_codon:yes stop_codon:yes gene_type:complete
MAELQKVKLSETKLTLWEVEFTFHQFYDKNDYTPEEAKKHFMSIADNLEPHEFEENSDESDENWYLSTEFCYYACDSGHGGNIINDCLVAMSDDGIQIDQIEDYDYKWNKLDISHDQEYLPMGLSTYGNDIKFEDGFLIGECLSEFIDNCSCKDCS